MVGTIDNAVDKGRRLAGEETVEREETEVEEEADAERETAEPAGVA